VLANGPCYRSRIILALPSRHLGSFKAKHGLPDSVQKSISIPRWKSFKLDVHISVMAGLDVAVARSAVPLALAGLAVHNP
jgi:hypothetical protein